MSPKLLAVIKSYARGVLVAITPLIVINETNIKAYVIAILAGVISPALRKEGFRIAEVSISQHRRGVCRCQTNN